MGRERRAIRELPRPVQDLLASVLNPRRRPCDRDGEFVPACSEFGFLRGLPHLRHDILELHVGRREGQRAFCLDFEDGGGAVGIRGLDDHVVQRPARSALLEFDGPDRRAGQTARLGTRNQR